MRMLSSSEGEYFLGRVSTGINAAGAACSREIMFPWCEEHPVVLAWCQTVKFEDKLS